jgi:hypothetical protein
LRDNSDAHFTDKYKQPGHPTFSNESIYSNEKNEGGSWVEKDNTWYFKHSPFTLPYAQRTTEYLEGSGEHSIINNDTIRGIEDFKKKIKKHQKGNKILSVAPPHLKSYRLPHSTSDNTQVQPAINPIEREQEVAQLRDLQIQKRAAELATYRNQSGVVSGMKKKPTASQVNYKAEQSVDYNNKLSNDPVGTLGPDLALALIPELLMLPGSRQLIGKGIQKINPFKGSLNRETYNPNLVAELRKELAENGILRSQKTLNLPWKEPIRKGIEPWGYADDAGTPITGSKFKDVKGAIFDGKNPLYKSPEEWSLQQDLTKIIYERINLEKGSRYSVANVMNISLDVEQPLIQKTKSLKKAIDIRDKSRITTIGGRPQTFDTQSNRYATWDMYLGKPQTNHPLYDISELTKSKKSVVYTIKEDFMNRPRIEGKMEEMINMIENPPKNIIEDGIEWHTGIPESSIPKLNKNNRWIVQDQDKNLFGTMGGFNWEIEKLADGNYKIMANDIWDLQPLQRKRILPKPIKNIEVGKALGIGKPLNVKVGFIVDGTTKKIINTFGLAPAAIATGAALQNKTQTEEPKTTQ